MKTSLYFLAAVGVGLCCTPPAVAAEALPGINGPLRLHPKNPRYFTDDSGRAILLTGSHTWNNLVDMGPSDPPPRFDYLEHLEWLAAYPHNFFRLWTWELTSWNTQGNREQKAAMHQAYPHPWKRTGPGNALDGKPKFNLAVYDDEYFNRLETRVKMARDRGLYLAVMLFEGWGIQFSPQGWEHHPFHPSNNVNGIDGDLDKDGRGLEIHTGGIPAITKIQQAYVRKVIDTVNEFDNVLYEISNENHPPSTEWQYGMIRFIKDYERAKPKQHPVGMTFQYKGGSNQALFDSPADWISPNPDGGYRDNPPPAAGRKVIVTDTDHLWGIGGNSVWAWKSFTRGLNPIFMDCYDGKILSRNFDLKWAEPLRKSLGVMLKISRQLDLAAMVPRGDLASSKYCLANPGEEYFAYQPVGGEPLAIDLPEGEFAGAWIEPISGRENTINRFKHAGGQYSVKAPFKGDSLLHLKKATP